MEDLQQFKQTYFEESGEFLSVAETGLLRLTPGNADMEEINAIFRAVHSIKGGGGAFGFKDLVAFAHEFETVMDGVRNCTIAITDELVDTLIRSNDVLGQLLRDGAMGIGALQHTARSAWIEYESDGELHINLDGEPMRSRKFRVECRPGALSVRLGASPLLGGRA